MWGRMARRKQLCSRRKTWGKQQERAGKGGREARLVHHVGGLHFSRGNVSGKDLAVPTTLGNPALAAGTFLPPVPRP